MSSSSGDRRDGLVELTGDTYPHRAVLRRLSHEHGPHQLRYEGSGRWVAHPDVGPVIAVATAAGVRASTTGDAGDHRRHRPNHRRGRIRVDSTGG